MDQIFQLYCHYWIEIHDGNIKINRDTRIHASADTATQHSLIFDAKKLKIFIFWNKSGIDHFLRDLKLNIDGDFVEISENAQSLGLIFYIS